jgi:acetyl esterase/lipase
MKSHTRLLLICLFALTLKSNAQHNFINIWNGLAPGTENRQNTEYWQLDTPQVYNVYQPDLKVYLPQKPDSNHAALIVSPGGGFQRIVMEKEGYKVARWLNKHGVAAFVLKYRLNRQEALQDIQRSVSYVRVHAHDYGIDPHKIGVIGFSAGAFLVGNLSTHLERTKQRDAIDSMSCRPDFAIGLYGGYEPSKRDTPFTPFKELVNKDTPPFFLVHAINDTTPRYYHSMNFFLALQKAGVPAELHLYETGGHGFALETNRGVVISWANLLLDWLRIRKALQ